MNNRQLLKTFREKGEIACNEQFLFFPQCFLLSQIIVSPFVHIFDIISLFAAEFEEPKIGISGEGLNSRFYLSQIKCILLQMLFYSMVLSMFITL